MATNFNTIPYKEYWATDLQALREETLVSRDITNYDSQSGLSLGQTIHRPYAGRPIAVDYDRDPYANAIQRHKVIDDTMVIDKEKWIGLYIDDHDRVQTEAGYYKNLVKNMSYSLAKAIDGDVFKEFLNAPTMYDAGSFGGTAGQPVNYTGLSTTAIKDLTFALFAETEAGLANQSVEEGDWIQVAPMAVTGKFTIAGLNVGYGTTDRMVSNGRFANFGVFDIRKSLALPVVHPVAAKPVAGDTAVITAYDPNLQETYTITFTWKATKTLETDILVGATIQECVDNFNNAMKILDSLNVKKGVAILNLTAKVMDGKFAYITTGKVASPNNFVATGMTLNAYQVGAAMKKGAIDLVTQLNPKVKFSDPLNAMGEVVKATNLYGTKLFQENKYRIISVKYAV